MKTSRVVLFTIAASAAVFFGATGCGKAHKKEMSDSDRKKADFLASEAQFAITMRNWAEAEKQLAQAVQLNPGAGPYWVSLGSARVRLGDRSGAKTAYKNALDAFAADADEQPANAAAWLQQVYVLALLGRLDDGRALLDKAAKRFPNDPDVVAFVRGNRLDAIVADPMFKEIAL